MKLVPVIKRIRQGQPESLKGLARMNKDLKTENLNMEEIAQHVKVLTGEDLDEICQLSGRSDDDVWEARWILHSLILYANEFGQPNGQDLHLSEGDSVKPSKPWLCHDERYLNLWVKDLPFHLENLKDVHRLVQENALMITCDEKSGYDHVNLQESSQTYFGIQFGGFYMTYTTLPFGWKASPFIYQSIEFFVTSYLRQLDVINALYIDDRFAVTGGSKNSDDAMLEASKITYMILQLLTRLGYTLSLSKCSLIPGTCKKFLGFLVDSVKQAYILPDDKKLTFIDLRKSILSMDEVDLRTLQRFCGKCISLTLAVPGCKLFCREVNAAISTCIKNSRKIKVLGPLRDELMHWRFLDTWTGYSKWRPEFHKVIELSTDSSGFRYGASVKLEASTMVLGDYWDTNDCRPIHEKEADAVLKSLQSLGSSLQDSRVDLFTDNMAVIAAWENQG
ncbi:unnamed protein product [Mytilus coruscus]|uniref:Reverse transcriptase domain-containing protein n=1 Tax=Mytilus coruscus TaxID=42192 RepID=A0A6J8CHX0_MYTCO|nr:unnamed protein product [Mytilus coruscus]